MLGNYIATHLIDVAALLLLGCLIANDNVLAQNRKGPFYLSIALTILITLAETGTVIADGNTDLRRVYMICNMVGFALAPIIPIVLTSIFDVNTALASKVFMLPSFLNVTASVLSPWLGLVFYVDASSHYTRGPWFLVFVLAYTLNLGVLLLSTAKIGDTHHYPIKAKISALSLFVVLGTSMQIIMPQVYSAWHSVTLALLLYYLILSHFDGSFDVLTRLHNRAAFEKTVETLDERKPYSVVVMDINDFKDKNDTYGHDFGDVVLKTIASAMKKSFDDTCTCYRIGGDEFYIICRIADRGKLEAQLRSLIANLEEERKRDPRMPTISYGYGVFDGGAGTAFQEVLKQADEHMYRFKKMQKGTERGPRNDD